MTDHILKLDEPIRDDRTREWLLPGWYFRDETDGMNGPFPSRARARTALIDYINKVLE